jgi:hypothetical protein
MTRPALSLVALALTALTLSTGCANPPAPPQRIEAEIFCEPLRTSARIVIIR